MGTPNPADEQGQEPGPRDLWLWRLVPYLGWALCLLAAYVPLAALEPSIRALAGQETEISLTVRGVIGGTLLGGAYYVAATRRKMRRQREELVRLRARVQELELELERRPKKEDTP